MNTEMTLDYASSSVEDTLRFAEKIGQSLKGGEVIELRSDVGGGKTTLVRGLAKGAGSTDQVASPTFTISRVYNCPGAIRINHYDFYRLSDPGLMKAELGESISDPLSISIIEWANIVGEVLPDDRLLIELTSTGEDSRHINLTAGPDHHHILKSL